MIRLRQYSILICDHTDTKVKTLAKKKNLEESMTNNEQSRPSLRLSEQHGVVSIDSDELEGHALSIDYFDSAFLHRLKTFGLKQDLAKACGLPKKRDSRVLDITAGMGIDAVSLAYLGARVSLLERNPMIFALLENAFERASLVSERDSQVESQLIEAFRSRLTLELKQDSYRFLQELQIAEFDCIYFDPMFPERKKSAKVKKAMQYFHSVAGIDLQQEPKILSLALAKAGRRVVVKRPKGANEIANQQGLEPSYVVAGKTVRFDVYLIS